MNTLKCIITVAHWFEINTMHMNLALYIMEYNHYTMHTRYYTYCTPPRVFYAHAQNVIGIGAREKGFHVQERFELSLCTLLLKKRTQ